MSSRRKLAFSTSPALQSTKVMFGLSRRWWGRRDQGEDVGRDWVAHFRQKVSPREIVWRTGVFGSTVCSGLRQTQPRGQKYPTRASPRHGHAGQRTVGPVQDRKPSTEARAMRRAGRVRHDPPARLRRHFRTFHVNPIGSSRNARCGTEP